MKIRGLEYLKCNNEEISIPQELEQLPESMKLFLRFYKTGDEKEIYQFNDYQKPNGEITKIRHESTEKTDPWIIEGDRLTKLLTINELCHELKLYELKEDEWHLNEMIKIGQTLSEVILLKLKGKSKGRIYLFGQGTPHLEQDFYETAKDIFDLLFKI